VIKPERAKEALESVLTMWEYKKIAKDVYGNTVYAAFFFGEFAGYRYRRSNQEIRQLQKKLGKHVGIRRWIECPEELVVRNPA